MGGVSQFIRRASFVSAVLFAVSYATANAQTQQPAGQAQNQTQQQDVASFNRFLSEHPDVEKQLKANPYLINDPNFMSTQPALKAFLADHPQVKSQLQESPVDLVRRGGGTGGTDANRGTLDNSGSSVVSERDAGRMDEFLDEHRDVEQQLELNPSLITDPEYLGQHRDLEALLNAHPQIRQQFSANPGYFTHRDDQAATATGQLSYRDVGRMDQFLDVHQEIRWQLGQNPLLINDAHYLAEHPEIALFLNAHPQIRQEFSEHSGDFVQPEKPAPPEKAAQSVTAPAASASPATAPANVAAAASDSTTHSAPARTPAADTNHAAPNVPPANPNLELAKEERTRTDQFLDDHPNIHKDLEKNPWLINQSKYLKHHKDLGRFLTENPQIRGKVASDPTFFTKRDWKAFQQASTEQASTHSNPNLNNRELAELDQFLAKHKKTAKELERDPMLVTSQHYIDHNKDLRQFFEGHPQILVEFRQNPRNFMDRENDLRAQLR